MEPRPVIETGCYFKTRGPDSRIVCKAYTRPPGKGGKFITRISKETFLGPVERYEHSREFATIEVRGWWINVWKKGNERHPQHATSGISFARKVDQEVISSWENLGWRHQPGGWRIPRGWRI